MGPSGEAWFHVHLERGFLRPEASAFNLPLDDLVERFVRPWLAGHSVEVGERTFSAAESKLTIYSGPRLSPTQLGMGQGWANAVKAGEDVTHRVLAEHRHPPPATVQAAGAGGGKGGATLHLSSEESAWLAAHLDGLAAVSQVDTDPMARQIAARLHQQGF